MGSTCLHRHYCGLYLPAPTLLWALPACTDTTVGSTCLHRHYCGLYLPAPTLLWALPACTDTTVFSTCTSEWSILSGLALQLTLPSALAAPGLILQLTLLSTLPVYPTCLTLQLTAQHTLPNPAVDGTAYPTCLTLQLTAPTLQLTLQSQYPGITVVVAKLFAYLRYLNLQLTARPTIPV